MAVLKKYLNMFTLDVNRTKFKEIVTVQLTRKVANNILGLNWIIQFLKLN